MSERTESSILTEVLSAYQDTKGERRQQILLSAIKHIHAFARETSLSRAEWLEGVEYLKDIGQKCDENRQEFILLSDLLGLSALVELQTRKAKGRETPGSVVGPFHASGSPRISLGESIDLDHVPGGQSVLVSGQVSDANGAPIAGAEMDIWQTAPNRLYAVQDDAQSEFNLRGKLLTNAQGKYSFITVKPVAYPVPRDGPCGAILDASGRHGMRAAHIHVSIDAQGYKSLVTEIFPDDDPYLEGDTVFAACKALQMSYQANTNPDLDVELVSRFDFVLQKDA